MLTKNQARVFWASWAGLSLDGMDSFLYALVLVPALRELLPRSGLAATQANLGFYGSILFATFLIGWGLSFLWGPLADRIGRVRALTLAILCYSVFTFLGALAHNVWDLALFRLAAGIGIGGEWTVGAVFVAEEMPPARRRWYAGFLHTGYYLGFFLAALVNWSIGAHYGWRAVFATGGGPALIVAFVRYGVRESKRWEGRIGSIGRRWTARAAFLALFTPEYRRRTLVNAALVFISMVGLWAGSVYAPSAVTYLAQQSGHTAVEAARLASYGSMLLAIGTILGCLAMPALAEWLGRRGALAAYFTLMFCSISGGFGYVYYLNSIPLFFACLFFLGLGGANFAVYTLWHPEQYHSECRGSAFAFCSSIGRFLAAGITFLVGSGVARMHTIGKPVAFTSIAFLVGLSLIPLAFETKGRELPE